MRTFFKLIVILFGSFFVFISCEEQSILPIPEIPTSATDIFYARHLDSLQNSESIGVPGKGSLVNGKIIPFSGTNFHYFSKTSYLHGRAFVNHNLKGLVLESYQDLSIQFPKQQFGIMECSKKEGGKISGHRTHQNGLSIDFMSPKMKENVPYYGLDHLGASHYQLAFNNDGKLIAEPSIEIDFEMMGQHILALHKKAKKHHLKIKKIILKKELKDNLYKTKSGRIIKKKKIYITMNLPPRINEAHDDHYHIDFQIIK